MHRCTRAIALFAVFVTGVVTFLWHSNVGLKNSLNKFLGDKSRDHASLTTWFENKEEEYRVSRERIRHVCEKRHGPLLHKSVQNMSDFTMLDIAHNLFYCKLSKVATTTMAMHFNTLALAGVDHYNVTAEQYDDLKRGRNYQLNVQKVLAPKITAEGSHMDTRNVSAIADILKAEKILTFVMVRHPFDRLVSAYEQQILTPEVLADAYKNVPGRSFPEFVKYVLEDAQEKHCFDKNASSANPTRTCLVNRHWRPYYLYCNFCLIDYDVIGRFEKFSEELSYVLQKKNLTDIVPAEAVDRIHRNPVPHDNDRTVKYFAQIGQAAKWRLYELYRLDFELFGYSPTPYI